MPSRMERYYENDKISTGRSNKNRSLYDQIQSLDNYTNIEGVETIENNNEIDISRVKKMINNRENYRKERELRSILNEKEVQTVEQERTLEEEKNYDINDILNKVKQENVEDENYRKLDEESYKELKDISRKSKKISEEDAEELNELLKTIKLSKEGKEEIDSGDDAGLLDDLKSDTVVGDASSIKKLIEEEKGKEQEKTEEIDRSFYTTNFGLTKKDFEDLKDLNVKVSKANNKIMIMLMVIIIIIIIAFVVIIFT